MPTVCGTMKSLSFLVCSASANRPITHCYLTFHRLLPYTSNMSNNLKPFDFRTALTSYRLTSAFLNGCNVDPVVSVLDGSELGHVRDIVRAARVCPSRTPLAYYDSLSWSVNS